MDAKKITAIAMMGIAIGIPAALGGNGAGGQAEPEIRTAADPEAHEAKPAGASALVPRIKAYAAEKPETEAAEKKREKAEDSKPKKSRKKKAAKKTAGKAYAGEFAVTAYCSCPICCGSWSRPDGKVYTASGETAEPGVTIAADWEVLPEGSEVEIEGVGRMTVQDKPADWVIEKYGGRIIDVYFDSHEQALEFGRREAKVWIIEPDGK